MKTKEEIQNQIKDLERNLNMMIKMNKGKEKGSPILAIKNRIIALKWALTHSETRRRK